MPIYWGDGEPSIDNKNRMLLFNGSNAQELVYTAEQLLLNTVARVNFFAQSVLVEGAAATTEAVCANQMRTFDRIWRRHVDRLARGCTSSLTSADAPHIVDVFWHQRGCRAGAVACCNVTGNATRATATASAGGILAHA